MTQSKLEKPIAPLKQIEFYGDVLEATEHEGKIYVAMRRACENLGLSWATQYSKIQANKVFSRSVSIIATESGSGLRDTLFLDLRGFLMWLARLNPSKIGGQLPEDQREEMQDRVLRYQLEAAEALEAHFMGTPKTGTVVPYAEPEPQDPDPTVNMLLMVQTNAAAMLESIQRQKEIQRTQERMEKEIHDTRTTVDQMARKWKENSDEMRALPPSGDTQIPDRPLRSYLVERMRVIGNTHGHRPSWNRLYKEYLYRYRIDLKKRAANHNVKALDVAEDLDVMDVLYDLCCHLWPHPDRYVFDNPDHI